MNHYIEIKVEKCPLMETYTVMLGNMKVECDTQEEVNEQIADYMKKQFR